MHFQLYQGYVKNTNLLLTSLDNLAKANQLDSYEFGALKRRFSWEFDGMRLHEFYFENLGGNGAPDTSSDLYEQLVKDFGSYDAWKKAFIATGMMRGIGWVILYRDPQNGKLMNIWINEHDVGHLAGGTPLLVMDVFEHAYMPQYGLDKNQYIQAFFSNINWTVVDKRYSNQQK
jgi:Fe-Mn family superoxide dismutase